jgi:hypothetical protein
VDWLYENPLPELTICGVLALAAGLVALKKQRGVFLLGTLAFLLLGGALWFLDHSRQTDREAVEFAVHDIVLNFQQNDLEGTLKYISPQAIALRATATLALQIVDVEDVRVTDVSVDFSNQKSIAHSHFRVNATASLERRGSVGHQATRWRAEWQKSDQGWLMIDIEPLDLLTGNAIEWPDPFQ